MKLCKLSFLIVLLICALPVFSLQEQLNSLTNFPLKVNMSEIVDEDIFSKENPLRRSRMLASMKPDRGEITASIMIEESSALLSNSEKVVFLSLFDGPLKIMDVSNPESPYAISVFPLTKSYKRGMAISPDDKTLYIAGVASLEIIDVSNLSDIKLLGMLPLNRTLRNSRDERIRSTISVSSDGKFVYVGFLNLEVYDISDPTAIILIYSEDNKNKPTTVQLMNDDKTLAIENDKLHFYNVSTPRSPVLISTFNNQYEIASFAISSDGKTAYLAYEISTERELNIRMSRIEILNISDLKNLQSKTMTQYFAENTDSPSIILSRSESHIYLLGDPTLQAINLQTFSQLKIQSEAIHTPLSFCLSKSDRLAYVATKGQFFVLQLLLNLQLNDVFGVQFSSIKSFDLDRNFGFGGGYPDRMTLSPDEKTMYVATRDFRGFELLTSYDISKSEKKAEKFGSVDIPFPQKMEISIDGKLLFINSDVEFIIVSVSKSDLKKVKTIKPSGQDNAFIISSDNTKLFVTEKKEDLKGRRTLLTIYDISTPSSPRKISSNEIAVDPKLIFRVNKDCGIGFFMSHWKNMSIINISDPANPILLFSLLQDHQFDHFVFSPNSESIAFVVSSYKLNCYLTILDLSDIKSPKTVSSLLLPFSKFVKKYLYVSPDARTAFVSQDNGAIIIDISDLSSPVVQSWINGASSLALSKNGRFLYIGTETSGSELEVIDLLPTQTVFFPTKTFGLGGSYSHHLAALQRNDNNRYDSFPDSYKFAAVSFYSNKVFASKDQPEISYSPLPNWVHFDPTTGILTLEPKSFGNIGLYVLHAVISTQVPDNVFEEVKDLKTKYKSLDVKTSLVGLGYLDNEGFLTSSFSPTNEILLGTELRKYESDIRNILKRYYFPIATKFRVESSLSLLKKGGIFMVNTRFPAGVNILVVISKNETNESPHAQFLSLTYSGVQVTNTNQKTRFTLDGSLDDINRALQELSLNLPMDSSYCNGSITISDGYNPKIAENVFNISSYFKINKPPRENKNNSIQSQVDRIPTFLGEFFQIDFSATSFIDENPDFLKYSIQMPDKTKSLPTWLTMKELKVSGIIPEQITLSKLDLVFVVSNEFKTIEVPFTIHFNISINFILKLLSKYASYAFSALGLYIMIYKIYNILGAKYYRHPKKFILMTGKEITANSIYAISFVAEELSVSQYLQGKIREQIARQSGKKTISDSQLVEFFINPDDSSFDKKKLNQFIEDAIQSANFQKNADLEHYASRLTLFKKLICDLIYYDMINKQINHPKEQKTKQVFDSIKADWIEFIEMNKNSQFVLKENSLETKLDSLNTARDLNGTSKLLENQDLNIGLLKDAVLGYVFQYHNLNFNIHDIDINVMEKVQRKSFLKKLKEFMKVDQIPIPSNDKGRVGYGIKYKIKQNTLSFNGVPEDTFAGRTLVIQIMTIKKRIIRELVISGLEGLQMIDSVEEAL